MVPKLLEPQARRWTLDEYYRLEQDGWFAGQRVMLIKGEIVQMAAHGHPHFKALSRVQKQLEEAFGPSHWVRAQGPLNVGTDTDPEPDVAVAPLAENAYTSHPDTALVAVEVSDTTLRFDRKKAGIYASGGVPEYWIVNINQRQLEVHREPIVDPEGEYGFRYATQSILGEDDVITPLARPAVKIVVKSLLP